MEQHIYKTGEFEFTYIGRLPEGITLRNHIHPIGATELAMELPKHDVYITASIEEAGANHVLESLAAGLPVVYHSHGGSINNYCHNYGAEYLTFDGLLGSIRQVVSNYKDLKSTVLSYDRDNTVVVNKYIKLIERIGSGKQDKH